MPEWDKRYYTLDRITKSGCFLIESALKQIRRDYDITDYPIDCFELVRKIQKDGRIKLDVISTNRFGKNFNAVSVFLKETNSYLIYTADVSQGWREHSSGRRCNFTLAHELGHIFLGHLQIPRNLKSPEIEKNDEYEADEFAGRLLMPEQLLLKTGFTTCAEIAEEYLVSEQALYKRLNNLKRLDLLRGSPKRICSVCGNGSLSPMASYCGICGNVLKRKSGGVVIDYPCAMTADTGRVVFCPVCGNEEYSVRARFCRICGTPAYNFCSSIYCDNINPANARYCEACGEPTAYAEKGLMADWSEEHDEYIRAVTQR